MDLEIHNELANKYDIKDWIGKIYKTNRCGDIEILGVHYKKGGHTWYICKFEDGYLASACKENIKKGKVSNPYAKLYFNIGYVGNVETPSKHPLYYLWTNMLARCYGDNYKFYKDIIVFEEWHSFEEFIKTVSNVLGYGEYIKYKSEIKFCIDKDIYGEKTFYSVENCCFIPHKLNTFICEQNKLNTSGYKNVIWDKEKCKWRAQYTSSLTENKIISKSNKLLGRFDTKEEAYDIIKEYKITLLEKMFNNEFVWIDTKIKEKCRIYYHKNI